MNAVKVIPATLAAALVVADNLREADRRELAASSDKPPRETIVQAVAQSSEAWVGCTPEGTPGVIFGVSPTTYRVGSPWMLATPLIEKHQIAFLRWSRRWVDKISEDFPVLYNIADSRNEVHLKWLEWLDFKFLPEPVIQKDGTPFIQFIKVRHHHV